MNIPIRIIESPYMTATEAAIYLRRYTKDGQPSVQAIYSLVKRGRLKPCPGSGKLLFTREALDGSLQKRGRGV
jgi:hypothetical protein